MVEVERHRLAAGVDERVEGRAPRAAGRRPAAAASGSPRSAGADARRGPRRAPARAAAATRSPRARFGSVEDHVARRLGMRRRGGRRRASGTTCAPPSPGRSRSAWRPLRPVALELDEVADRRVVEADRLARPAATPPASSGSGAPPCSRAPRRARAPSSALSTRSSSSRAHLDRPLRSVVGPLKVTQRAAPLLGAHAQDRRLARRARRRGRGSSCPRRRPVRAARPRARAAASAARRGRPAANFSSRSIALPLAWALIRRTSPTRSSSRATDRMPP